MYSELLKMTEGDKISQELNPKVESIQSWITCYSAACKLNHQKMLLTIITMNNS